MKIIKYIILCVILLNLNSAIPMELDKNDSIQIDDIIELEKKLIQAAYDGDLELVKNLVSKRINVNCFHIFQNVGWKVKWTPLHAAVSKNHLEIVQFLLQNFADPNFEEEKLYFIREGYTYKGCTLDLTKSDDIFNLLLRFGANPNYITAHGVSDLISGCSILNSLQRPDYGHNPDLIKIKILVNFGIDQHIIINSIYESINKIKYYSNLNGQKEVAKFLIDQIEDFSQEIFKNKSILKPLEEINRYKDREDTSKVPNGTLYDSLLAYALRYKCTEIIKYLLEKNENLNQPNILQAALDMKNKEILEKILSLRFIKNNNIEMKDILVKLGINYKDRSGNNLLHYAVKYKNLYFLKLIWYLKPTLVSEKNYDGNTPIELAKELGYIDIINCFNI